MANTAVPILSGSNASASTTFILSGQISTAAVSTPTPVQNSTAVSIRGGLDASASAVSILSGQLSTAATSVSKGNPASS